MQRIEYVNLKGERAVFEGGPPFVLEHVEGLGAAPLSVVEVRGAYQQGATFQRLSRGSRVVEATFHVQGDGRRSLYARRQRLLGLLSPQAAFDAESGAMGRLYYQNDYGTWWTYAVPELLSYVQRVHNFMVSCPLAFRCPSPFWVRVDPETGSEWSSVVMEMLSGDFTLPFSVSAEQGFTLGSRQFTALANNLGQTDAPVLVEVDGTGEQPTLYNRTTGTQLSIGRTVPTGERLVISTAPEDLYVRLQQHSGESIDASGYLSLDSSLLDFVLAPGANALEYMPSTPSERSRIKVSWRTLVEGV